MSVTFPFPESVKSSLKKIAIERDYPVANEILARGSENELTLTSATEAQIIVNIARVEMLNVSLTYPYWDEDDANFDPLHESAFQDVQMELFEKVVMYISQEFKVTTTV